MKRTTLGARIVRDQWSLIMLAPTLVLLFLFAYLPIYGVLISFQEFRIGNSILGIGGKTEWVGVAHFRKFLNSIFFSRVFGNTIRLSLESLVFGFWVPIAFSLLLNEVRHMGYRRVAQTFVYLPYFISTVIVVAILMSMTSTDGAVNKVFSIFGREPVDMINEARYFDALYVVSGIWQHFGYSSIIYIAAMSSIDPTLYEAATVDGANRLHRIIHITLPGIVPTIVILLILSVGGLMGSNTEKILLMINPANTDRADVIGTYVYNTGLRDARYSYSAAVGLFANVINFVLVFGTNMLSRRFTEYSLW